MRHLIGGIMTASILLLAACGGDGDDDSSTGDSDTTDEAAEGDEYVDALAASITEGQDDLSLDDETAECVATSIVDVVGVERLEEADITPEEFAEAEKFSDLDVELPGDAPQQLGDSLARCEVAEPLRPLFMDTIASNIGIELSPEATACIEENITDEGVGRALGAVFIDGSEEGFENVTLDALLACPRVATDALLQEAPNPITPEIDACVDAVVRANRDLTKAALVDQDPAAQEQLGAQIGTACPEAFAPAPAPG